MQNPRSRLTARRFLLPVYIVVQAGCRGRGLIEFRACPLRRRSIRYIKARARAPPSKPANSILIPDTSKPIMCTTQLRWRIKGAGDGGRKGNMRRFDSIESENMSVCVRASVYIMRGKRERERARAFYEENRLRCACR